MNAYITLDLLKATGGLNISGTGDDTRLRLMSEAVSRVEDRWTNRHFYSEQGTFVFDGGGDSLLMVPDLISIDGSGLKVDDSFDGTYNETWAAADFILRPSNASPTSANKANAKPYTSIEVNLKSNGTQEVFPSGQETVQIAGTWGYWQHLATATETVSSTGSFDATATSFDMTTGIDVQVGHTINVDVEQMYVTSTGTGTTVNVQRGVNGSTGTVHANSAVIEYFQYPDPVREVCIIETSKLWRRKDSGFASSVGFPETGEISIIRGFDQDSKMMLAAYRRMALGGL